MRGTAWSLLALLGTGACGTAGASEAAGGRPTSADSPRGPVVSPAAPTNGPSAGADSWPDPDGDDDRILDVDDSCPTEPETYNGIDDEDGCPDQGQVLIDMGWDHGGRARMLFRRNSADMEEDSGPVLDAVAAILTGHPQVDQIACVGRAGPRERDPRGLSLARAAAAREGLLARGIAPARLQAFGAGATAPITEGEAFHVATERSVTFELLVVGGVERNRWNGQRLEVVPAADDATGEVTIVENVDVYFQQVYFARNSAHISEADAQATETNGDGLNVAAHAERVACIGHAARREQVPKEVSQQRADAVCELLVRYGVDAARLESHGVGARMPTRGPGTGRPYDAARERRVVLVVLIESGTERLRWTGQALEAVAPPATEGD